jgi:S1-C subfamily serine protease
MHYLAFLLLIPGQIEVLPSSEFSQERQLTAVAATVRIASDSGRTDNSGRTGSGAFIGRKGKHVYILTAHHLVKGAGHLEVATFSVGSYPRPSKVYRSAEVVAATNDIRDLAVLRLATDDNVPVLELCPALVVPDKPGFSALAVGCTGRAAPTCLIDKVLASKRVRRETAAGSALFWEVDRKHSGGRSGGPLIDARGHLLGVLSGTSKGRSYFCHTEEIRSFLKEVGIE